MTNHESPSDLSLEQIAATPWRELIFVSFDTETSGKYPLTAEICEIAAVKWRGGEVVDTFQTLIKPSKLMDAEVIAIHGITNDMVENAPRMHEKIAEFHAFIQGAIPIAHHAPFDLGFVALEFEKVGLPLPTYPALCSSLLSRKLFPESRDHRLQTLIGFFQLERGAAHRALDDAKACLEVGLRCLQKTDEGQDENTNPASAPLSKAFVAQGGPLTWQRFSMKAVEATPVGRVLIEASREQQVVEMVYTSGSTPGKSRRVHPMGLVRSLDGDFLVGYAEDDQRSKRYLLERIQSAARA